MQKIQYCLSDIKEEDVFVANYFLKRVLFRKISQRKAFCARLLSCCLRSCSHIFSFNFLVEKIFYWFVLKVDFFNNFMGLPGFSFFAGADERCPSGISAFGSFFPYSIWMPFSFGKNCW
ncbi:MAG: hypothetical protein GXZ07_08830 [Firmicutes bacterium]|nr:hypothetical protein [Bacillota bacterium]